jgi:hypothetical protein
VQPKSASQDLGNVPFRIELLAEPRVERERPGPKRPMPALAGGALSDLQAVHGRGWKGQFTLRFGTTGLTLSLQRDLDCLEEFVVFLIELVDAGAGEWGLPDGDRLMVLEAQAFGPDLRVEFADEDGGIARFRGQNLPRRATVRLRAFVEEGAALVRKLIVQSREVDPKFGERPELLGLEEDLAAMVEAVAGKPRDWKAKEPA